MDGTRAFNSDNNIALCNVANLEASTFPTCMMRERRNDNWCLWKSMGNNETYLKALWVQYWLIRKPLWIHLPLIWYGGPLQVPVEYLKVRSCLPRVHIQKSSISITVILSEWCMDHLPLPSVPSKTDACRGIRTSIHFMLNCWAPSPFPFSS